MVALNSSLADVPWAWSVAQCLECVVEGAVLADFGIDFDLDPVIVVAVTAVLLVAIADPELVDLVAVVDECCQVETIASHSAVGQCDAGHIRLVALCYGLFYRYIVVVRWWIPCLPLLCLWWLALLCLLLLLRLVVRIVCVRRHSRRRDRCCRAVRRRCSYSFGCSTGEIPPAGSTIATATVGAAALSRATQLLLAVPVLGVCCFQACVHDLE